MSHSDHAPHLQERPTSPRADGPRLSARRAFRPAAVPSRPAALVVAGYLLLPAAVVVALADLDRPARDLAYLVLLVGGLWIHSLLRRFFRDTVEGPAHDLDHRQVALRAAAYRHTSNLVFGSTLVVMGVFVLGPQYGLAVHVAERHWEALFWAAFIGALLTPYAVVAWKQREA